MEHPKVVCLIEHLNHGGEEKLVYNLMPAFKEYGIEPWVITFKEGALDKRIVEKGVGHICLHEHSKVTRIPALMKHLKELAPEIIHTRLFSAGFWGRIAAHLSVPAAVINTHPGYTFGRKKWKRLPIEKALLKVTDRSVCVSQAVKDHLMGSGGMSPEGMVVIPNGIDVAPFASIPPQEIAVPARLITVARLARVKGHDILLRALPHVSDLVEELLVVGDGPEASHLRTLAAELQIESQVRFLGSRDDIPELLAKSDLFIAPSRSEGLPVAILEAMAAARPVVATAVGGSVEVVQDVGWLAPPEDPGALAREIRQALINPNDTAQMVEKARNRVKNHYDFKKMIESYLQLYGDCSPRLQQYLHAREARTTDAEA